MLAACALASAILACRPPSAVSLRLSRLAARPHVPGRLRSLLVTADLERSGLQWDAADLIRSKLVAALAGAALAATATILLPLGPVALVAAAYAGFVLPTVYVERAAARRRSEAERALVTLIEWAEALVASGQPAETALVTIASRGLGAGLVDGVLASSAQSYALGAPLLPSLAREASSAGLSELAEIATALERSRGLGRGALTVLRDERDRLRASERARSLDAAARVEGRLMLVLVLCYLPALMLLVVIPLFLSLLEGLFV